MAVDGQQTRCATCYAGIHGQCLSVWAEEVPNGGCPSCGSREQGILKSPLDDRIFTAEDLEVGGPPEEIPLAPPPSRRHWAEAFGGGVLGRDLAACLLAKDWQVRETALRRLAREAANALRSGAAHERLWRCAAEVLARAAADKVFRVYLSSLRCLRTLLVFTRRQGDAHAHWVRATAVRPVLTAVLAKCADGNRRVAALSVRVALEISRGECGAFGLGRYAPGDQKGDGGGAWIDFVLQQLITTPSPEASGSTAVTSGLLGRLIMAEHMLTELEALTTKRLTLLLDFAMAHVTSKHASVSRSARTVFARACARVCADPHAIDAHLHALRLLSCAEPTLRSRLRRTLRAEPDRKFSSHEEYLMMEKLLSAGDGGLDTAVYARSASQSPSRMYNTHQLHHRPNKTQDLSFQRPNNLLLTKTSSRPLKTRSSEEDLPFMSPLWSPTESATTAREFFYEFPLPLIPGLTASPDVGY